MKNAFLKLIRFWNEDRSLTAMLLLLVAFIFVLIPSINPGRAGEVVIKVVYSIMLLTGILSVAKTKRFVIIVGILAMVSLTLNWVSDIIPTRTVLILHDFSVIIFNLFFALVMLVKTFQKGEITFQRIEGSIVVKGKLMRFWRRSPHG